MSSALCLLSHRLYVAHSLALLSLFFLQHTFSSRTLTSQHFENTHFPLWSMVIKWFWSFDAHYTMLPLLLVCILPKCTLVWFLLLLLCLLDELCHGIKHRNGLLSSSLTHYVILHTENLISGGLHTLPWIPMLIYLSTMLESTKEWPYYSLNLPYV